MSNATWQLAIALLVVAAALFVLGRRVYRFVKGKPTGSCSTGGCGTCTSNSDTTGVKQQPLVQLGDISSPKGRENSLRNSSNSTSL